MELHPKTCLFIGVDIQPLYVNAAPEPGATLARIRALRDRIAKSDVPSMQVAMEQRRYTYTDPAIQACADERYNQSYQLCFPLSPSEDVFFKRQPHPTDPDFEATLKRINPEHILIYGYYLDCCASFTAQRAEEVLRVYCLKPEITVIADCGQRAPRDIRDWEQEWVPSDRYGRPYPLITSTQLRFPHEPVTPQGRAAPTKASRLRL